MYNHKRLAVLIDAENISPNFADDIFKQVAPFGLISLRRAFTDFSNPCAKNWSLTVSRHAISPYHVARLDNGKNACDLALVINAMDLLHSGRHDGFCIVTSDRDFTGLATRIREHGLNVFGFGEQKAPASFQHACTEYVLLNSTKPSLTENGLRKEPMLHDLAHDANRDQLKFALSLLAEKSGYKWMRLSEAGTILAKADMKPKTLGFSCLSKLIETTRAFDMRSLPNGQRQVRLKCNYSKMVA